ncbi:hypothetical protein [Rahnella perminowiae]|uniref:hypothetical protein n=1 Tax=Rahnella perminowiae TaxID=2816244 RepID=UPI00215CCD96|nr:hypothetical protein [Rahnella perminowiae]MCR8998517.1 hypothetical protein [Rahnella perminowiae]
MADGISVWVPVISALAASVLTGTIQYFMNRQNHYFALEREEKARAERLLQEKEVKQEKIDRERHFIAIELVFLLEQFAETCSNVVADRGEYNADPQPTREPTVDYPELSFTDVTGNWQVLDTRLMYRIRELLVLQREARNAIAYAYECESDGECKDYFRERKYQYARLGLKPSFRSDACARWPDFRIHALRFRNGPHNLS